jgi:8-oxo-dGTP pyrophosphatase MutT (NUDIX family)
MGTEAIKRASTVVPVRETPNGLEVFLVKRSRSVAFMPSAWVFPGGKVDETVDQPSELPVDGLDIVAGRMGLTPLGAGPAVIAGVRELFEETGIWLGTPGSTLGLEMGWGTPAEARSLREVCALLGMRLDVGGLIPWSRWVTPPQEPRRYDTWFFVARVDQRVGRHDEHETVDSRWLPLEEAVRGSESGDLPMAPPTWWTLRTLLQVGSWSAIQTSRVDLRPIQPVLLSDSQSGLLLALPGHPDHAEPARDDVPPSITFSQGRWWAQPR